jgi:TatD DNase family protein
MLPLDAHAHIEPGIDAAELAALRSCVIAVTRTLDEFETVRTRSDSTIVWGAGVHPGLAKALRACTPARVRDAVAHTPVVGEIGLDGGARTRPEDQLAALRCILRTVADTPRLLSVHSYRASGPVLRELQAHQTQGVILHWWLGGAADTDAAVDNGALFSVNASQAARWPHLDRVPLDRVLVETDHPFGDRVETQPRRPGNAAAAEAELSARYGVTVDMLRTQTWRNLFRVTTELKIIDLFPKEFRIQFVAA